MAPEAKTSTLARSLGVLPLLFAIAVLIGWEVDSEGLRRLGLSSVTMSPTTACGFLLLSSGLVLHEIGGKKAWHSAALLLCAAATIGVLKLADLAIGTHFNIDAIVFASKLSAGYARPSRIAPNAALCFIMTGAALWLMRRRGERAIVASQVLALATALVGIFAIVGHLYGIGAFYIVAAFHPMALHTAGAFLCLSAFVLMGTSRRGLVAPITDKGPAGRTSRALLPAAVAIPVAFGWLRQEGESAGLYPADVGIALMVMLTMLTLTALVWQNARWLLAADRLRVQAEATIVHIAAHDFLTGLANRGRFMERLMARVAPGDRLTDDGFAVICMDLDGLKQVNDRLGHAAGDNVLRQVGCQLKQFAVREGDLAARVGGDEFAMLLDNVRHADDAIAVARRIVEEMPRQVGPEGNQVPIGISIGVVIAERRHCTPEILLADADNALYHAKRTGKGRFAVYAMTEHQGQSLLSNLALELG